MTGRTASIVGSNECSHDSVALILDNVALMLNDLGRHALLVVTQKVH